MLSIEKKQIMIEHFQRIGYVSNKRILVLMKEETVEILGDQLKVLALGKDEILIEGNYKQLLFAYEQ